ncbi:unnamed protein product [Clonostachys rosea]|uniref:Nucleoside phosphorylase domain-containing protein n=1 Tax=Bionectria ochroleuca TaxID=29856 RepID=A0ABY6U9R1_BIOOC|nr:unnamed protein product [Clonostachys rosea]
MDAEGLANRTRNKRENVDTVATPSAPKRQRARPPDTSGRGDRLELTFDDYTVGWVCALPIEMAAAIAMLDCTHEVLPKKPGDDNEYGFGNIGSHNIVIACLPSGHYGTNSAAVVANNMKRSFPSLETRLMVGIGGGVPLNADIRLGDVVVGHEVLQYDFGKTTSGGEFHRTSSPVKPPHAMLTAVARLRAEHEFSTKLPVILSNAIDRNPSMGQYKYPSLSKDRLFESSCEHDELRDSCDYCDQSKIRNRPSRPDHQPKIHYGTVASGNQVIKHGETRDKLSSQGNILCFEMEAAGMVHHFPCLVVRGICDYCDSHKNKQWQPYAAATAAAYAKELLFTIQSKSPKTSSNIGVAHAEPAFGSQALEDSIQQKREKVMVSLEFEQMNARRLYIKNPQSATCRWLLSHPVFLTWEDPVKLHDHGGFLWLKGHPGTGKSTIMKCLLKETQRANLHDAILNFFFNARGHGLEKTTTGMYRSLLRQIFQQLQVLQNVLDSLEDYTHGRQEWTVEALEELFEQTMERATPYSIICFVDALDECNERDVRQMLKFFERMGRLSLSVGGSFKVCFSSRHYPHITFRDGLGLEIILQDQKDHGSDITKYIKSELKLGDSTLAHDIHTGVHRKASGIFMWAVLVVEILNRERDHGRLHSLQRKLQNIPSDLHQLFRLILGQQTDTDSDQHLHCFQLVLFAKKPLTPTELYFALIQNVEGGTPDPDHVSNDDIRLVILEHSKGLAEITKSESPTVEFIHESVRDFLLGDGGLSNIWPGLGNNLRGKCHNRLRDSCLKFIRNDLLSSIGLNEKRVPFGFRAAKEFSDKVKQSFPFLEYAVENVFFHANLAESHGIPQKEFLSDFPCTTWCALDSILQLPLFRRYDLNSRLNYILAARDAVHLIKYFPSPASFIEVGEEDYGCPLLIAVANKSEAIIEHFRNLLLGQLSPNNNFRTKFEELRQISSVFVHRDDYFTFRKSRSVISYLAQYNLLDIVAFLVSCNRFSPGNETNDEEDLYIYQTHSIYARELLDTNQIDPCSKDNEGRTLVSWAAEWNNPEVIKILLKASTCDVNSEDNMKRTPISWASARGSSKAVKYLLQVQQVQPDMRDGNGHTPLSLAAARRSNNNAPANHLSVVQLLLETGRVDPDSRDHYGRTPLIWAAKAYSQSDIDHGVKIFRALVQTGRVDLNSADNEGYSPLIHAVQTSNIELIQHLLTLNEIDFELRDDSGRDSLSWAVDRMVSAPVFKILLQSGRVNPDSRDENGRSALSWAASCPDYSSNDKFRLLLQSGKVDADSRDHNGRSPLSWSVSCPDDPPYDKFKLLLQSDQVDPDSRDHDGRSPLSWATSCRHFRSYDKFELLLQSDKVDADSRDHNGRSPLSWAASCPDSQSYDKFKLLLRSNKVDPDSRDHDGRSPLSWAASCLDYPSNDKFRLLLHSYEADPDSRDHNGRSPLSWAAQSGNFWFMEMLDRTNKTVEIDSRDNQGHTPLWWAAWSSKCETTLRWLISTGKANPKFIDNNGTEIFPPDPEIRSFLEEWKALYIE